MGDGEEDDEKQDAFTNPLAKSAEGLWEKIWEE